MTYSYYLTFCKYSQNNSHYSASLNLNLKKISCEIHPIFDANGETHGTLVEVIYGTSNHPSDAAG